MRVVVTGAGGRLGRVAARWFADRGDDVLAIDRHLDRIPAGLPARDVDLADPDAVAAAVKGADAVVHLAALRNPDVAPAHVVFGSNTQATYGVLTGAAKASVPRVVYASSGASYGLFYAPRPAAPDYLPIDEDHPQRPADPYSLSKAVDELAAAAVHREGGPTVIGLRFPFVRDLAGLRAHADRLDREPVEGARQLWAYLEITDLARAIDLAARSGGVECEVIGLAAADTLSRTLTADLLHAHYPDTAVRVQLAGHAGLWNTAKAQRLLGWQPATSWRDGDMNRAGA